MKIISLNDCEKMFKNTDKEKIIAMYYEVSKNLCEIEEALRTIDNFIHREEY